MSGSFARVGETLHLSPRWAVVTVLAGLVGLAAFVAMTTRMGMLATALAMVVVGCLALVSLRWPMLALFVFVAMIPIEQVVIIDGFGTIARLAGVLFAVSYLASRLGRVSLAAMPPAGWAFLAWSLLSLGWAMDPNAAWAELPTLLQLFVIAVFVADVVVQRPEMVRSILWVYSGAAAATALIGVQAYVALGPAADIRATALEDQNPAQFAAVLLPAVIFGLYELVAGDRRILGGAIAFVTTVGVVVSGTRGAWLSVAVVVVLFILPKLQFRRQVMAIAAALLIGAVTLQIPGVANLVAERAVTAVSSGGAGRTDIWTVGFSIYQSTPVLGVGYANFPVAYTGQAVRDAAVSTGHGVNRGPHNLVIGTLTELGPIGLLFLAMFLLPLVLRQGWGPDAATVQASLASLLLLALFLDILGNRKQVWLIIGLAVGLGFLRRSLEKARSDEGPAGLATHGRLSVHVVAGADQGALSAAPGSTE
jgi:hypothetical protein